MTVTAAQERAVLGLVPTGLLVAGVWREGHGGFPVTDPATGEVLVEVADASPQDGLDALAAAADAAPGWASTPPQQRSDILAAADQLVRERVDDLALLMTLEMGKPLEQSAAEVRYSAGFLRWFSEEAVRIDGRYGSAPDGGSRRIVHRRPVGPCLFVTPWNFPMAMGARKIGPALAAGCTMVVKPAAQTPLSMLALAQILVEAGVPPGVCNVVPTSDAAAVVDAVMADARLRKLSFTGSTATGRALMAKAAQNVLRVSLELGGNAPFLVFEDADLDAAVEGAVIAKTRNIGEACTAANRFLVAEEVAPAFAERLATRLGSMQVGRGTDAGVEIGPLIDDAALAKVEGLVADATARGAQLLTGGERLEGPGCYYAPTVLSGVERDAEVLHTEIFGPVAPVVSFTDEAEAVALANDTPFGLVAYAYTRDLGRAVRLTESLEVGMLGVNRGLVSDPSAPFGGVKQSGFGREGGREGIDEYVSAIYVSIGGFQIGA
jgi:succinate-semialdehyde dehydrogenase / glutarate-semialdehyde dehydrogenase